MEQGYVLTAYFYDKLTTFEKEPQSFKETIGEIVYGMDVPSELSRAKHIEFSQQNEGDVVHRGTRQLHGLDLAEMKLMQGDVNAASTLAHQELDRHTGDIARADSCSPAAPSCSAMSRRRATTSRRPSGSARIPGSSPGPTSTSAAWMTWSTAAMRPFASISRP